MREAWQGGLLPDALTPLTGWRWRAFLAIWSAALLLALAGIALFFHDQAPLAPSSDARLGFLTKRVAMTGHSGDGAVVAIVLSHEAIASGMRPGDRITAVGGIRPAGEDQPVPAAMKRLGQPASVVVETVSSDGVRATHLLSNSVHHVDEPLAGSVGRFRSWRLARTALELIGDTLTSMFLGCLLLIKRPRDPLAPWAALAFVLIPLSIGVPRSSSALFEVLGNSGWYAITVAACWLLTVVVALFPDGAFRPRWVWPVLVVELGFALFENLPSIPIDQQNMIVAASFVPPVAVIWAKYRLMPPGTTRQQIRWVLFGLAGSVIAYFLATFFQTIQLHTTSLIIYLRAELAALVCFILYDLLMIAGMTVGLLRYRLYDADSTISRSVAYGALTLSLLAIFAGTEKIIELLGEEYFGASLGAFASALGAGAAAALIVPFHNRSTRWAERRFRSGLVNLREELPLLVGDLRDTATPTAIADDVLGRVERGVRAKHGAVVLRDTVLTVRDTDLIRTATWVEGHELALTAANSRSSRGMLTIPCSRCGYRSTPMGLGPSAGCCWARAPTAAPTAGRKVRRCAPSPAPSPARLLSRSNASSRPGSGKRWNGPKPRKPPRCARL